MTTIKVMSAGAVEAMVKMLGAEFEKKSGHKLDLVFNTAGNLRDRVKNGEAVDLIVLPPSALDALGPDTFVPGTRTDLGRTVTGVTVREGAPVPDISTPEAFKQALLLAKVVSYTDPKAGGSSGTFFAGLLQRLGIADQVNKNAIFGKRGYEVAQAVADGRADIGTTFISEILTVKGAKVVGPLPGALHNVNTYSAAVAARSAVPEATKQLLGALTDPANASRWTEAGLEPAFVK